MTGKDRKKIREAIKELGKAGAYEVFSGKVATVNEQDATCEVEIDDNLLVPAVRLRAVVTDLLGFWVLPKINSDIIIAQIDGGTDFIIVQAAEIDKLFISIGNKTFEFNANEAVFNSGANGGLVKVIELTQKVNAIENKLNAILTALNATVIPLAPSGTYPLSTVFGSISALVNTVRADIENADVKH